MSRRLSRLSLSSALASSARNPIPGALGFIPVRYSRRPKAWSEIVKAKTGAICQSMYAGFIVLQWHILE